MLRYVDTDCFVCSDKAHINAEYISLGADAGQLKYRYGHYDIRGQKMYSTTDSHGRTQLKVKGVPINDTAARRNALNAALPTTERVVTESGRTLPYSVYGSKTVDGFREICYN